MGSVWTAELDGMDRVRRNLDDPKTLGRPVKRFLELVTEDAHNRVIDNLRPRHFTGQTASSVHRKLDGRTIPRWGEVRSDYYIMRMLESGTKPHLPRVKGNLERWAKSKGLDPYAVARSIGKKGTRRRSIFRRARFATRRRLPEFSAQAGREIVREINGL